MNDIYCKCKKSQPVKQTTLHESYWVCSRVLGGCGKEIKDEPPEIPKDNRKELKYDIWSSLKEDES